MSAIAFGWYKKGNEKSIIARHFDGFQEANGYIEELMRASDHCYLIAQHLPEWWQVLRRLRMWQKMKELGVA